MKNQVDVYIPLLDSPVTDTELRAAGIDDLEVLRAPQGSNPSWVSKDQLERLLPLLPPWPEYLEAEDEIAVSSAGAGFGDPLTNALVEAAAMNAVIAHYTGWEADDVSAAKVGWDITFTSPDGEVFRVEVKGARGDRPIVLLTANELRAAEGEANWFLAVVTRALSTPSVVEYTAAQALAAAKPYTFKADLTNEDGLPHA